MGMPSPPNKPAAGALLYVTVRRRPAKAPHLRVHVDLDVAFSCIRLCTGVIRDKTFYIAAPGGDVIVQLSQGRVHAHSEPCVVEVEYSAESKQKESGVSQI